MNQARISLGNSKTKKGKVEMKVLDAFLDKGILLIVVVLLVLNIFGISLDRTSSVVYGLVLGNIMLTIIALQKITRIADKIDASDVDEEVEETVTQES